MPDIVDVWLDTGQEALRLQVSKHLLSGFKAIQSAVGATHRRDLAVLVNHSDPFQAMPFSHFKVGRVMRRRDLHNTGTEFTVDDAVLNER